MPPRRKFAEGSSPDNFNAEFDVSRDGRTLAFSPHELDDARGNFHRQCRRHGRCGSLPIKTARFSRSSILPHSGAFWFEGAEKTQVEGLLLRPPHFDASKKYPLLLLIHGGPQGEWDDSWGYRWNQQVMAAPGYVVVMINPRGSTGYGQKFTAEISRDWGGKAYEDLMNGVDAAIAKYPFIDGSSTGCRGRLLRRLHG